MLLKNFLFYITSFHALISLLTGRNSLFMQKLCFAQDVEASQAGMDNQSPLLRLLSSDRSILSTGAALAVKEVVFIRAERGWPVFGGVCCGLLCPGKAKLCFSAGCMLAQPVMSLIFSLVDWWHWMAKLTSPPAAQQLNSITPCHLLPQRSSFSFSNHWRPSQQTWGAGKWRSWILNYILVALEQNLRVLTHWARFPKDFLHRL